MKNYSAPPGSCTVPGCGQPRYINRYGKRSTRCAEHVRERNKRESDKKKMVGLPSSPHVPENTRIRQKPAPDVDTVSIMVLDWKTEQVLHVTGSVACTEPFPRTDGDLKKTIAQASQQGIYIAYIRAYKSEDLYESN